MSLNPFDTLLARIEDRAARVGVIGLGYVGLPLTVTIARQGYPVTGFDIDPGKIVQLEARKSYIEAVTDADLADLAGSTRWTADFALLAEMDVIIICVPTPLTVHRDPDLSYVISTAEEIARHISSATLVVLESPTYPGTTVEDFRKWWYAQHAPLCIPILGEEMLGYDQVHVDTATSREAAEALGVSFVDYDAYDNLTYRSQEGFLISCSDADGMALIAQDEQGRIDNASRRHALMREIG